MVAAMKGVMAEILEIMALLQEQMQAVRKMMGVTEMMG
jgi:hypothetical protein